MTRFADALGTKYTEHKDKIFHRKFDLGGHTFTVRIPYVQESDEIYKAIQEPALEKIEATYIKLAEPLMRFKDDPENTTFEFTENDIIVGGRSMRETAKTKVQTETKITEYFKLLVPEDPAHSLADLTYEEIEAEFPLAIQFQLLEKIAEVISPTYKETRGN
jgi:hypothetical protein